MTRREKETSRESEAENAKHHALLALYVYMRAIIIAIPTLLCPSLPSPPITKRK